MGQSGSSPGSVSAVSFGEPEISYDYTPVIMKGQKKKYLFFGMFCILGAWIFGNQPFSSDLNTQVQQVLGIVCITVGIWVFKPFGLTSSLGGFFLAASLLAIGIAPAVVFGGFTQASMWTLVPTLYFGYVLQKSGLGNRIALTIIRLLPANYGVMLLAWVMIGIILSILTPSITVRVAIIIPIAVSCGKL